MRRIRFTAQFGATLLACIGLLGMAYPVGAQGKPPRSGPIAFPKSSELNQKPQQRSNVVERVINLPGRGPMRMRFLRLPRWAIHKKGPQRRGPIYTIQALSPILYSSNSDYTGDGNPDALWLFPTLGYDPANTGPSYRIPNTIEENAPTGQNTADVALGQIGNPALINHLEIAGGMADIHTFAGQSGSILILMFDGVDQNAPPDFDTNVAQLQTPDDNAQPIYGYIADFSASDGFAVWQFDFIDMETGSVNPYVLNDPRGRFGLMVAKLSDTDGGNTAPDVQWIGLINSPNGPNRTYHGTVTPGDTDIGLQFQNSPPLASYPADLDFNQGASHQDSGGVYNYFLALHGTNRDGTTAQRGTLLGNLRRRGVNPPHQPDGSILVENKPGSYLITAYRIDPSRPNPDPANIVRQDTVFTQPSYDANGSLTVNYKLEGYPAGTFDIAIRQLPIVNAVGQPDTLWPETVYPFADYVPMLFHNVTIPNGGTRRLDARLERFGDITDSSLPNGTGPRDGLVDYEDLNAVMLSLFLEAGEPGFNPAADITSDPGGPFAGRPDGVVDFDDLNAVLTLFFSGHFEQP